MIEKFEFFFFFFLLKGHVEDINKTHLRDLMSDAHRCESMMLYASSFFSIYSNIIFLSCS